ncbi:MAG: C25 family cysteine peptidase [Reichenbachiella sp.]
MNIIESNDNGVEINYLFPGGSISEKTFENTLYQMVHIDNFTKLTKPGKPAVPVRQYTVVVPKGMSTRIEFIDTKHSIYEGYTIEPAREPASDLVGAPSPKFIRDDAVYNSSNAFPSSPVTITDESMYRGQKLITIQICPVLSHSATEEITVYSQLHFRVVFEGSSNDQEPHSTEASPTNTNAFINNFAINSSLDFSDAAVGPLKKRGNILIVTTNEFLEAADSLALWKKMMGYTVEVVSKSSWQSSNEVKDVIHSRYKDESEPIDFCTIIGDHSDVPAYFSTYGSYDHVTDLYYASMDGSDDYVPDIAIGRLAVGTAEQAMIVVAKIIKYERTPVQDPDFFKHGVSAAYFEDKDSKDGYADRRFAQTSWEIRKYLITNFGYTIDREFFTESSVTPKNWNNGSFGDGSAIPDSLRKPNYAWDADAADISRDINEGRFMLYHRDHGLTDGWGDPYYRTKHIRALKNGDKLPVVFSLNCQTGKFNASSASFAEAFIRQENGGAVGVVAATEISYSGANDAFAEGMIDAIWPDPGLVPLFPHKSSPRVTSHQPIYHMGYILNQGKMRMAELWSSNKRYSFELFHYFGDPSMLMWTDVPKTITASIPQSILTNDSLVTITNINALEGIVTLSYNGIITGRCEVEGDGSCTMNLTEPITNSTNATITITSYNYRPLMVNVDVIEETFIPTVSEALFDVGDSITVDWITKGEFNTVVVEMSIDNFMTTLYSDTIPNANTHNFIAPNIASDSVLIRLSNITGDPSVNTSPFSVHNISTISGIINENLQTMIQFFGPENGETETDSVGQFTLDTLMPGEYKIVAVSGIYNSDTSAITVPGDTSGVTLTMLYPDIELSHTDFSEQLSAGLSNNYTFTITNTGTAPLHYSVINNSVSEIVINEVNNKTDYVELKNSGKDINMSDWTLQWTDDTETSGSYTFPEGYMFKENSIISLYEINTPNMDSVLFLDVELKWTLGSKVAIALIDPSGKIIDFVKTEGAIFETTDSTIWNGPGVNFDSKNISRNSLSDTDHESDWIQLDTGTTFNLNNEQTFVDTDTPPWITIPTNENGVVPVGSSQIIQLDMSAISLLPAIYADSLYILSNAPNSSTITIPVYMNVIRGTLVPARTMELYDVGDTITIDWATDGIFPSVIVEASTDNFVTSIYKDTIANIDTHSFIAPAIESDTIVVRISDAEDHTAGYTHPFSIHDISTVMGSTNESTPATIHYSGPYQGTVVTDSIGNFILESLMPGSYTLVATAGTYKSDTISISVPNDISDIKIALLYPEISISTESLSGKTNAGDIIMVEMEVSNIGDDQLIYSVQNSSHTTEPNWITVVENDSGSVEPNDLHTIEIELSAQDLIQGMYTDIIFLNSNSPTTPVYQIPITLQVIEKIVDLPALPDAETSAISDVNVFHNTSINILNNIGTPNTFIPAPENALSYSIITVTGELIQSGIINTVPIKLSAHAPEGMLIILFK